jgi:hypothetical protein
MPEHAPKFVREFSREKSAEERSGVAAKIRAERGEYFQEKKEHIGLEKQIQDLENRLDEYNSDSFLNKIKDYFKVRAARESLGVAQARKTEIGVSLASRDSRQSGQDAIETFYEAEKKKWGGSEYSKEDIVQYFTEEHLASLSVEDYALLMKRFPSEMVTHVTRQGVRDHWAMSYHVAGVDKFHDGFTKMLDEKRLKSPLAVRITEALKEEDLVSAISRNGEPPKDRKEALELLERNLGDKYVDTASVHFAAEEVADLFYGSEKGNEIFVAYPSAFVASQYASGHNDAAAPERKGMWNDVWVRDADESGMNLDAALVFIPKNARVSPHNGSRYEINTEGQPIRNEEAYQAFERVAHSLDFESAATTIKELLGRDPNLPLPSAWDEALKEGHPYSDTLEKLIPIRDILIKRYGIKDDRILRNAFGYKAMFDLEMAKLAKDQGSYDAPHKLKEAIDVILEPAGQRFVEAEETIPAQEYWEKYFLDHPGKRPSKVVYYEGTNPTQALFDWQTRNGIKKKSAEKNMGFAENRFNQDDLPLARQGSDRFESLIRKAIDDRFPEAEEPTIEERQDRLADDSELPPPLPLEDQDRYIAP